MPYAIKYRDLFPFECALYENSQTIVNFGVVFSPSFSADGIPKQTESIGETFIPQIENKPLKRKGDIDYFNNNILNTAGDGVVYLEIQFVPKQSIDAFLTAMDNEYKACFLSSEDSDVYKNYFYKNNKNVDLENWDCTKPQEVFGDLKVVTADTFKRSSFITLGDPNVIRIRRQMKVGTGFYGAGGQDFNAPNLILGMSPLILDTAPVVGVNIKFESINFANTTMEELEVEPFWTYLTNVNVKKVAIALIRNGKITQFLNHDYVVSMPFYFREGLLEVF